ncbi:MAG: GGDEF domain-containing protein [Desulfobacterales bacterium]|nr:GGDEF domain-containing protein [Desulfobacterales bacterium]
MTLMDAFFKDDIQIPSPPSIAVRILDAVKKDEASFDELAKIISSDPALSAKILKVTNSSFYALPQKIDSIPKALSVLGTHTLKNIALSFVIAKGVRGPSEGMFDFDFFWKRALTAAVSADILSPVISDKNEDIFVTALLQDIGITIMYLCRTGDYLKVLDEKRISSAAIEEAEKKIFGFDHQELGSEVLKHWGIPETIYEPVRYHHKYDDSPQKFRMVSNLLLLSDKMSSVYHGTRSAEKFQDIKSIICNDFGVNEADLESLVDSVAERSVEIFSFFEIDPGNMKPFSQILQEANKELGKLNLTYEQLIVELKQAKEKAEKFAQGLKDANEKLRELALRDGLTGLYNHRYFQELMDNELSRARRYKKPISLVLLDLDHFKKINDTYGHPVGDIVLKEVSKSIKNTIRESDTAARYGGEEFAIVLPETDLKGAAIVAERLRRAVERQRIDAKGINVGVTISVGAACYQASAGTKEKSEIIASADNALYSSKHTGRNKISVVDLADAA